MSIFIKAIHFPMPEKYIKEFRRLWNEMILKNEAAWNTPMIDPEFQIEAPEQDRDDGEQGST